MINLDRAELLAALKRVQPALSKSAAVPILESVFFTDYGILATNDVIAILTLLPESEAMSIPGIRLIKLLESSSGKNVRMTPDGNGAVRVSTGGVSAQLNSHGQIARLEPPFVWPPAGELAVEIDSDITEALKLANGVADPLALKRLARGVHWKQDAVSLRIAATDAASMVHTTLPYPGEEIAVILTCSFVEELCKMGPGTLSFSSHGYALFDAGSTGLFGRVLVPDPSDADLDFDKVLAERMPAHAAGEVALQDLDLALARAFAMIDGKPAVDIIIDLEVTGDKLIITTTSKAGEVVDELDLVEPHPPIKVRADRGLLARAAGLTRLAIDRKTIVRQSENDSIVYMVGTHA